MLKAWEVPAPQDFEMPTCEQGFGVLHDRLKDAHQGFGQVVLQVVLAVNGQVVLQVLDGVLCLLIGPGALCSLQHIHAQ